MNYIHRLKNKRCFQKVKKSKTKTNNEMSDSLMYLAKGHVSSFNVIS